MVNIGWYPTRIQFSFTQLYTSLPWTFVKTVRNMFDRCEKLNTYLLFPGEKDPDDPSAPVDESKKTNFASLTTMTYMFSHCLALTPTVFRNIVATWTFEDNPNGVYGDGTHAGDRASLFGNNENNKAGDNNGANYIFREETMTDKNKNFYVRAGYATQDGHTLYIGGGKSQKNARLTTKE